MALVLVPMSDERTWELPAEENAPLIGSHYQRPVR